MFAALVAARLPVELNQRRYGGCDGDHDADPTAGRTRNAFICDRADIDANTLHSRRNLRLNGTGVEFES